MNSTSFLIKKATETSPASAPVPAPQVVAPQAEENEAVIPATLLGGILAARGLQPGLDAINKQHTQLNRPMTDPGTIDKLRTLMNAEHVPVLLDRSFDPVGSAYGHMAPGYEAEVKKLLPHNQKHLDINKGLVFGPKSMSAATLAHELGHATGWHGMLPYVPWLRENGNKIAPLASMGAALTANPDDSLAYSGAKGALQGGALGALVHSPVLLEEMRANRRSWGALKKLGLNPEELANAGKARSTALATYLLMTLGPSAIAGTTSSILGRQFKRIERNHEKETIAGKK